MLAVLGLTLFICSFLLNNPVPLTVRGSVVIFTAVGIAISAGLLRVHNPQDVYGGMAQWVNVDKGGYQWPPETPVGTNFDFRFVGEYNYMKTLWGMNEVLVATLRVFERTGAEWAARYFGMAQASRVAYASTQQFLSQPSLLSVT